MKIFRMISLLLAMGLFVVNFLVIDVEALLSKTSLWAYFRMAVALLLVFVLLVMIARDMKKEKLKK